MGKEQNYLRPGGGLAAEAHQQERICFERFSRFSIFTIMKRPPQKKKAWIKPEIILVAVENKSIPNANEHSYMPVGGGKWLNPNAGTPVPFTIVTNYVS